MKLTTLLAAPLGLALATSMAWAQDITFTDAYARAATPMAKSGAAFLVITNDGDADDRLLSVSSDAAARVELHTHTMDDKGVMSMVEVTEGFVIPAGETLKMERGGAHVMFMGLTQRFEPGTSVDVTFVFEKAGDVVQAIPVDLER